MESNEYCADATTLQVAQAYECEQRHQEAQTNFMVAIEQINEMRYVR